MLYIKYCMLTQFRTTITKIAQNIFSKGRRYRCISLFGHHWQTLVKNNSPQLDTLCFSFATRFAVLTLWFRTTSLTFDQERVPKTFWFLRIKSIHSVFPGSVVPIICLWKAVNTTFISGAFHFFLDSVLSSAKTKKNHIKNNIWYRCTF